jgi:hypothetical protein
VYLFIEKLLVVVDLLHQSCLGAHRTTRNKVVFVFDAFDYRYGLVMQLIELSLVHINTFL